MSPSPSTERRIKVLWLTKGLGPGGAERLLLSFASLADHERFEFHAAYLLPWKDHLVAELESAGVHVHCLDSSKAYDPRWTARLRRFVREHEIDVVHNHSPLVATQARLALRALPQAHRPALVGTEHNMWSSHNRLTRGANRATIRLEDHTFAVSDQVRESMSSSARARTEVLIHGVGVDAIAERRSERDEARARLGLGDELVVVTVANLRANKDYPTMLRAARRLVDDGLDVRFLSVGQGPLEGELAALRDALELGDRFRFLGYQADPIGVLAAGDVFCLSSKYEGLPIALLEAMAMGLPSVVTDVGGVSQVITDRVDGLLVASGDVDHLARGLSALVEHGARQEMSQRAMARSQAFDISNAVNMQQHRYRVVAGSVTP
ncbi:glycosyltransferase [Actinospongicola halichondriae]|uniref:glycosyltransferase n=1 Tax=Actinospongicola halichondriae TaxID=3236844 RepID=UPI003D431518